MLSTHAEDEAACDEADEADEAKRIEELERAFEEDADINVEHEPPSILVDVDYEGEQVEGDQSPAGVKNVKGKEKYVVEDDTDLFKGRDELWQVLPQESAAGSDEFEYEDAEEMASRIKDLDDLRGDWLPEPEGDDEAKARRAKDLDDVRGDLLSDDDEDYDYAPGEDSDSAYDTDGVYRGPPACAQAIQRKQRRCNGPTPASTTPAAGSLVRGDAVRAHVHPAGSGQADSGPAVPGPPPANRDGGSQPAFLYVTLQKLNKDELKAKCRKHGIRVTSKMTKKEICESLAKLRGGTDPSLQLP